MNNRNTQPPSAPKHLRPETKRWWATIVGEFELEPHHLRLLQLAAEAWDRGQQAREAIDKEGAVYTDRFGQPTARPEVAIERDSRTSFARLLRELALDVAAPDQASRPPAIQGRGNLKFRSA